jgi:hypothetical protein
MTDRVPKPKLWWESLAEQRIREAQSKGEFDDLPGFGKPIAGIDEPHDELWWVKEKLKREQISGLPPALELRLDVQKTLEALFRLESEHEVEQALTALNERIRRAILQPVWGPPIDVQPLDVMTVLARWRAAKPAAG